MGLCQSCNLSDVILAKVGSEVKLSRNRIFGIIGVVWGGAVVVSGFFRSLAADNTPYAAGQIAGFVLAGLMFFVGLYYAIRG